MKKAKNASLILALLLAFGVTTVIAVGCTVTARTPRVRVRYRGPVVRVRTPPPPPRRRARRACPAGAYWKYGAWKWHGNRWVWHHGGCKRIPSRYRRRRCTFRRGRWVRVKGGYRRRRGRWVCR
jgi:hypothetical protein